MKKIVIVLCSIFCFTRMIANEYQIKSPDGKIAVTISDDKGLTYRIDYNEKIALTASPLGIYRDDCTYSEIQKISRISDIEKGTTDYQNPCGKFSRIHKPYVQQEFQVEAGKYVVIFRVYNHGVAYAYRLLGDGSNVRVYGENSGFSFPGNSRSFLTQLAKAKSGWEKTNPSYEDPYHADVPLCELSEHRQGWIFPALIHHDNIWTLISETGTTGDYVACHLSEADGNLFNVEFPTADQNLASDPTWALMKTPSMTPWRLMAISDHLGDIVETTLAEDLVKPLYASKHQYIPGKASWSWIYYGDSFTTYEGIHQYIDLAAKLNFRYCLIDAQWDQQIGREKIKELATYGRSKNVGLILWYNSNGSWNTAPQTPMNCMTVPQVRRKEMEWLHEIGIAGIKVDFFGGDKQSGIKLYEDILRDANDFGILVNFHGATLPRGWSRMYPAFLNAEAVMGQEFCRGDKEKEAGRSRHDAILPFTRNAVGPMDFTPVVMNERLGSDSSASIRSTTTSFELALPIIFFEPLAHFGITPDVLNKYPEFVWDYFRSVPTVWDETKFLSGYPGHDVVIARRSGNTWYVAGINGEKSSKKIALDLSFAPNAKKAMIIATDIAHPGQVVQKSLNLKEIKETQLSLLANDGFVMILNN